MDYAGSVKEIDLYSLKAMCMSAEDAELLVMLMAAVGLRAYMMHQERKMDAMNPVKIIVSDDGSRGVLYNNGKWYRVVTGAEKVTQDAIDRDLGERP